MCSSNVTRAPRTLSIRARPGALLSHALGGERRQDREPGERDGERGGDALVLRSRPPEEPEDRDGKRRPVGACEEYRGAELAQCDREREAGCGAEGARGEWQVDLAPGAGG